jgi:aryl-alcohol dehydrogenase-like predicted oxidoreductase
MARTRGDELDLFMVEDAMTNEERLEAFAELLAKGAVRALTAEGQAQDGAADPSSSHLVFLPSRADRA